MSMMEVSARTGENGIHIGVKNRKQHFKQEWDSINVEIDGQFHEFKLKPGFWKKCPHIDNSNGETVIHDWLQKNFTLPWSKNKPPHFYLLPLGYRDFRLQLHKH